MPLGWIRNLLALPDDAGGRPSTSLDAGEGVAVEALVSAHTTEPLWGQQARVRRHRVILRRQAMGGFHNPHPFSRLRLQLAAGLRVEVDLFEGQTPQQTLERLRVKLRWRGYDLREVPARGHRTVAFYVVRDGPATLAPAAA